MSQQMLTIFDWSWCRCAKVAMSHEMTCAVDSKSCQLEVLMLFCPSFLIHVIFRSRGCPHLDQVLQRTKIRIPLYANSSIKSKAAVLGITCFRKITGPYGVMHYTFHVVSSFVPDIRIEDRSSYITACSATILESLLLMHEHLHKLLLVWQYRSEMRPWSGLLTTMPVSVMPYRSSSLDPVCRPPTWEPFWRECRRDQQHRHSEPSTLQLWAELRGSLPFTLCTGVRHDQKPVTVCSRQNMCTARVGTRMQI